MLTELKFREMQQARVVNPVKKQPDIDPAKAQQIKRMAAERYTVQQIASVVRVPIIDVRIILGGLS